MDSASQQKKQKLWREKGRQLKVASLFTGIGGLDLGLQQSGHDIIFQAENDPKCRQCLFSNFPMACLKENVESIWELPAETELLAAGFPCQDVSINSTSRSGMEGFRTSLVVSIFRLLKRTKVPFVLLENVEGVLFPYPATNPIDPNPTPSPKSNSMLSNASSSVSQESAPNINYKAPVISFVVKELELLGYSWAYRVIDTRAFGVPQRRKRVFLLASLYGDPRDLLLSQTSPKEHGACGCYQCFSSKQNSENQLEMGTYALDLSCWNRTGDGDEMCTLTTQNGQRTMLVFPRDRDPPIGTLSITDAERLQGLPADWTLACRVSNKSSENREFDASSSRFSVVGNAVSVPVAKWIGDSLAELVPTHKYLHGQTDPMFSESILDREIPISWPRAAWGAPGIGRFEAKALLESPGPDFPVLEPFVPLGDFLKNVADPPTKQAVQNYIAGLNAKGWELSTVVKSCLMKHYGFKEEVFFSSFRGKSLVWAKCPKPYNPIYWPAFLLSESEWPEKARKAKRDDNLLVVRFMDNSWLFVEEGKPYLDFKSEMECQETSSRWSKQFEKACTKAWQEYQWSNGVEKFDDDCPVPEQS